MRKTIRGSLIETDENCPLCLGEGEYYKDLFSFEAEPSLIICPCGKFLKKIPEENINKEEELDINDFLF